MHDASTSIVKSKVGQEIRVFAYNRMLREGFSKERRSEEDEAAGHQDI